MKKLTSGNTHKQVAIDANPIQGNKGRSPSAILLRGFQEAWSRNRSLQYHELGRAMWRTVDPFWYTGIKVTVD